MSFKSNQIFVNLSAKDVQKSTEFFKGLGFEINPHFSDESTTCLILGDNIFTMIMSEDRFKGFTKKEIADTSTSAEAIFALSANTREQVDEMVNKAISSGGKPFNEPQDHGFMYIWGFEDLDGHLWEVTYMDPSQLNQE